MQPEIVSMERISPGSAITWWPAFRMRIFIASKSWTSPVNSAPARSQSGRPAQNASSITHWRKFSCVTGARSSMPSSRASASSAGPVAGTMQSTIELGNAQLPRDPAREIGVRQLGEPRHDPAQDAAVALQVVAAQAGERPPPLRPPDGQGRDHRAEGRAGRPGTGRVVADVGMLGVEAAARVEVVAALGHGERDDAGRGIGHAR